MPAASARASTRCLRRPDPGPRSAGTDRDKARLRRSCVAPRRKADKRGVICCARRPRVHRFCATHAARKIDKFASHDARAAPQREAIHARITSGERDGKAAFAAPALSLSVPPQSLPVPVTEIPCSFRGNFKNYGSFQEAAFGLGENFPGGRENHGNAHGRPQGCSQGRPWLAADCRREAAPSPSARIRPNSTSGIRSDEVYARNCTPPPISARYTIR